jgi:hypothetical protein
MAQQMFDYIDETQKRRPNRWSNHGSPDGRSGGMGEPVFDKLHVY